jgi:hypothetical protein
VEQAASPAPASNRARRPGGALSVMLLAQAAAFFPPWYFWLFVFAIVLVIFSAITTMVVYATRAEMLRRIRERELAAQLIDQMLKEHHLSAAEIEQVMNGYWLEGSFWRRLRASFSRPAKTPMAIPPQKPITAH